MSVSGHKERGQNGEQEPLTARTTAPAESRVIVRIVIVVRSLPLFTNAERNSDASRREGPTATRGVPDCMDSVPPDGLGGLVGKLPEVDPMVRTTDGGG